MFYKHYEEILSGKIIGIPQRKSAIAQGYSFCCWMKTRQRNEIAQLERKLRKLEGDKKFNDKVSSNENITPDMIVKAKNYPIENLVEVNKQGFAKCIWHKEKTPSMFCKKNFANCFSCGKNGDTIAVLMERDSLTFKEAVLKLQ